MVDSGRGVLHLLCAGFLLLALPGGDARGGPLDPDTPWRGVAVLSSSIGEYVAVDELIGFVEACGLDLVVVDYCWITYQWPRTDHEAVRHLVRELEGRGVEVAAMYRPRAMYPSDADVHWARGADGAVAAHHNSLCLAHEDSVAWGASWGTKILGSQPGVRRVILYNVGTVCCCAGCAGERGRTHATAFLERCRRDWRRSRPDVEIGHVGKGDEFAGVVDILCPFFSVNRDPDGRIDVEAALARAREPRSRHAGTPVVLLLKACWGGATRNTSDDVAEAITLATRTGTGFFLWYYEWLFRSEDGRYDRALLLAALGGDAGSIAPAATPGPARRNSPSAWAYLPSRENREVLAPVLLLTTRAGTTQVPVSRDAFVAAYLPESPLGTLDRLSLHAGDANRDLIAFQLPESARPADLVRAEFVFSLRNGTVPFVAPLRLAVHAVNGAWEERTVTWQTAPAFAAEPVRVVEVEPPPTAVRIDVTELVREWVGGRRANHGLLLRVVPDESDADPRLDDLAVVAVKDFLRIENRGEALPDLEFPRYLAPIDGEQFVLARWVDACTDGGESVAIGTVAVEPDEAGNLLQRYRIGSFPARTGVSVTVTSLVLRREPPPPAGRFPIPAPDAYPAEVRPYLRPTAMIVVDHAEVRAVVRGLERRTSDALETARELATLMRGKSYRQQPGDGEPMPVSARVLKYGGSCCGSAVAAAAVLRARGIPAQLTYCPAGRVHGMVRFYLAGYGWCRMDATCGTGRLPLVDTRAHRGLVRLFDMPTGMEARAAGYAWPYQHNTQDGEYVFLSAGRPASAVRFAKRDEEEARKAGRLAGWVARPFPHLEPGSWNSVLDLWEWRPTEAEWQRLVDASRRAVLAKTDGVFEEVAEALGDRFGAGRRATLLDLLREFGPLAE